MDGTKLKRLQPNFFPQRPILTSGSPANNFFCFCSVVFNSLVSLPVSCCIMHVLSHDDGGGGNEKPVFCEKTKERDETNHLIERFEFFGALVPLFTSPDLYMRKERKAFWRPKLVVVGKRDYSDWCQRRHKISGSQFIVCLSGLARKHNKILNRKQNLYQPIP